VSPNTDHRRLGRLRQGQGELANHIIDEFAAGRLSRRDFIRRATVVGVSVPLLGSILEACSSTSSSTTTTTAPTLVTENIQEIPEFAQIVAQSAAAIGVKINLNVESQSKYYGNFAFGGSDWLDGTMSLVDYGHRSVPNLFLGAPLQTINTKTGTGVWNAAHFNNSQYDSLVAQYVAALDLSTQRSIAGQIQTLLLNETPIIYAYFYNYLTATATGVTGVYPTAIGHLFLYNAATASGAPGAVIKAGITTPAAAINPLTVADQGGLDMLAQTGEYLTLAAQDLTLQPVLATSWSANSAADVWTFKIRQGVKFHNGSPLTADDVVYTYKLQTGPGKNSALGGVLTPSGVVKVDDYTVAFHLVAPNGNFPYLTSSENYNMIIMPNNYDPTKWQSSFLGTGPFVLSSYTPKVGANFTRNESYWGTKALPSQTQFTFYDTQPPSILALTGGTIDVLGQFSLTGAQALLNGGYNIIKLKSSAHRELSMRCDQAPFTDPRVRQAIALSLNRPQIISALFKGLADIGNDSPFWSGFASTDTSIPQRTQNISQAKSLLTAAGHPSGLSIQLKA
jgi:ABC-type transport system substrate-binding protein